MSVCTSSVQWTVLSDGVVFELEAITEDLDPLSAHYLALGISKDTRMVKAWFKKFWAGRGGYKKKKKKMENMERFYK